MNDGLFETILVRSGTPIRLREHLDRLAGSAKALGIRSVRDLSEVEADARARAREAPDPARMRILLGPDELEVEITPFEGCSADLYRTGAAALLAETRGHPLGEQARLKIRARGALDARREAARTAGAVDEILLDEDGALLEGTVSNVFVRRDGVLLTPTPRRPLLPGVTRAAVLAAATAMGIPAREVDLWPEDVGDAEEAFLTSSLVEVLPLCRLGHVEMSPGPVARQLLAGFRAV